MSRRTWMAIPVLAGGVVLAPLAGPPEPVRAKPSPAEEQLTDGMTREELASLYQELTSAQLQPPACVPGEEMFTDVPATHLFCPWIEELARRGITGGCTPTQYCPGSPVTRDQMAVFVVRSMATTGAGSNSNPGYGSGGTFNELRSVTVEVGPSSRPVLIIASNEFWGPGTTCSARIRLEWEGVQQDTTMASQMAPPAPAGNNVGTVMTQAVPVLPAGTQVIKLYGAYFNGCFNQNSKLAAIVLDADI